MKTDLNADVSLGYTGQRRSALTGTYLLGNGYRSFNPIIRRFSAWDSLSPFGDGGAHGYSYCAGDPVNSSDPTGHVVGVKAIGAVIVAAEEVRAERAATGRAARRAENIAEGASAVTRVVNDAVDNVVDPVLPGPTGAIGSGIKLGLTEGTPKAARKVKEAFGHYGSERIMAVDERSPLKGLGHWGKGEISGKVTETVNRKVENLRAVQGLSPFGNQEFVEQQLTRKPRIPKRPREVDSSRIHDDVLHGYSGSDIPDFADPHDHDGVEGLAYRVRKTSLELLTRGSFDESFV